MNPTTTRPTSPHASPVEQSVRDAKADMIRSSRDLSPLQVVRKHPISSVVTVAATTFTIAMLHGGSTVTKNPGRIAKHLIGPLSSLAAIALGFAQTQATSWVKSQFHKSASASIKPDTERPDHAVG